MSRTSSSNSFIQRICELIRGPNRLREDIADEIADHLAAHAEEQISIDRSIDPADAEARAIAAFGEPQHRVNKKNR